MSSIPIRARLALAFSVTTALVLAGAFGFVYQRLRADLDDSVAATLVARRDAAAELYRATSSLEGFPLEDAEEAFVVVVSARNELLASVGGMRESADGR